MLKKLCPLSLATLIISSGYTSAKVVNVTTDVKGQVFSAAIHNATTNNWIPLPLSGDLENGSIDGDIDASALEVGHYDKIRFTHGPIQFKGYIEVTDDLPAHNGIYTTVGNLGAPQFKKTNDISAANFHTIPLTGNTESQAEQNLANEGVGSYADGNNQVDMGSISLDIIEVMDANGNSVKKADTKYVTAVIDKSYLWMGTGFVNAVRGDQKPIDKTFMPSPTPNMATLEDDGDTLTWTAVPGVDGNIDAFIEPDFLDSLEITIAKTDKDGNVVYQ